MTGRLSTRSTALLAGRIHAAPIPQATRGERAPQLGEPVEFCL